jgi:SAM-dependent methyltransferase
MREVYSHRNYSNRGLLPLVQLVGPQEYRILDIGCGDGANMRLLRSRGHAVVGVTLSDVEARDCQGQHLTCVIGDVARSALPFADGTFDALLLSHFLEHMPNPELVLRRCGTALRDGGILVCGAA